MTSRTSAWKSIRIEEIRSLSRELERIDFFDIETLGDKVVALLRNGSRIAFLGNGGSAAEAMHFAAEFVSKCSVDHPPISAVCLNSSQSVITAVGNDYGFEYIFERAVRAELRSGDLLIALTTSGKSKNVLNAIAAACEIGVEVVVWTGNNPIEGLSGVQIWNCSLSSTPRIQELHLIWGHLLAEYVERQFT